MNKELWPEFKGLIALKLNQKQDIIGLKFFLKVMHVLRQFLNMQEAQDHPHNIQESIYKYRWI